MERYAPFVTGQFYHIYNRGVDKRKIFFSDGDWNHFMRLLYMRNNETSIPIHRAKNKKLLEIERSNTIVDICAYALMPNHFHLLLYEKQENGISSFMQKLLTSYSMYMNKKYERTGPLMCRPFRAKHVGTDNYLQWLFAYIHLNPLSQIEPKWKKKGISDTRKAQDFLETYQYSSYWDYLNKLRDEKYILNETVLPFSTDTISNLDSLLRAYVQGASFYTL